MKKSSLLLVALLSVAIGASAAPKPKAKPKPASKSKSKPAYKPKPTPKPAPKPTPTPQPVIEPIVAPVETGPKTWALLVGVGRYQSPQINALRYPAVDATGVRDALLAPRVGGLAASQVLLLTDENATRAKILGAVGDFLRPNVKKGDKIIVFLAGHGVAKGAGLNSKSFLLPNDVKGLTTPALESSAVPLRQLSDDLATLPASQFVLFVDACREDPTPGRGVKGNSLSDVLSRNVAVVPSEPEAQSATFFACSIGQRAFEDPAYGHGVFTKWILDGLEQGAVPQKPDGAIDMGRLSTYVKTGVGDWAKETSARGDFEVDQTPDFSVSTQLSQPMVLMRVKREFPGTPVPSSPPRLVVVASLESAQISINGARAGVGSVERDVPEGSYSISVSAPGYAPISRTVTALGGYEQQIAVQLEPLGAGTTPTSATPTAVGENRAALLFAQAEQAAAREQWEIAEQGYKAVLGIDPRFMAAREALYELHRLQNQLGEAISDALGLVSSAPRSAASFALLSRAYSRYASQGTIETRPASFVDVGQYKFPKKFDDAVKMAQKAATDALALDANSPQALRARGYALAALDAKGKNKRDALAAWGKAAFLDANDAENHLALGYGIRFYAAQAKENERGAELGRAIGALNEAVRLRPNFYEAHRELAFCYITLGDTKAALRECRLARSNRGGATDENEIAGVEVAMAGLHQKQAENSSGEKKTANEAASQGYLADAKDTAPNADLRIALSILNSAGVSTSLASFLPAQLRPLLDIRGTIQGKVNQATGGVLGGLGNIFGR